MIILGSYIPIMNYEIDCLAFCLGRANSAKTIVGNDDNKSSEDLEW